MSALTTFPTAAGSTATTTPATRLAAGEQAQRHAERKQYSDGFFHLFFPPEK